MVNTYYLAVLDCIMMSPCFAALVDAAVEPVLNVEHDQARWVRRDQVDRCFIWPGQRQAIEQIVRDIVPALTGGDATVADLLRV